MVDTDKIDWEADGTILLPTITNCLEFGDKTYAEDGLERFKSEQWVPGMPTSIFEVYLDYILNKTKVLPIISDPTDVDTDGDGYTDDVDPRPLISDVTRYEINMIENYIPVEYDGPETHIYAKKIYYGGNQSWFYDEVVNSTRVDKDIEEGGCGLISAADLIMYLTFFHSGMPSSELFELVTSSEYEGEYVKYEDYDKFVRHLNDIKSPWRIGILLGFPPNRVKNLLNEYFEENDISIKARSTLIYPTNLLISDRDKILQLIIHQLENDIPVPLMGGLFASAKMRPINMETGEEVIMDKRDMDNIKVHWVNVVAVRFDEIEGTVLLEVACWGKKYLIDYNDYYNIASLANGLDGVVWLEKQ